MKVIVRAGGWGALALAAGLAAAQLAAQTPSSPQHPSSDQPAPQAPQPGGKVIFSRSTDENGNTKTEAGPDARPDQAQMVQAPEADDAERLAAKTTAMHLDVHIVEADHQMAARARLTVMNSGKTPLARIPLQISSSLRWDEIRVAGQTAPFHVATLNSDADHTGQLHEAAVALAAPLAPGASIDLDVMYSGSIEASAKRLIALGTPEEVALHSDWDTITPEFTGLRGFGNVVWYPVSSVPIILGDGNRLFDEIGRHKLSLFGAQFTLRLTVEFPRGQAPAVAVINGAEAPLDVRDATGLDPALPGIATAVVQNSVLGFEAPSLFLALRTAHTGPRVSAWTLPDNEVAVGTWMDAADRVAPFVERWLGAHLGARLTLLDLPDPDDAPFETGALLATSLHEGPADRLEGVMAHALAHADTESPARPLPAWLNEGLATFVETLWVESRHGRDQALGMLEANRAALALAEPASPGAGAGTPLAEAIAPVYYRTKAAYVFWMLRDLVTDDVLAPALAGCTRHAQMGCPLQQLLRAPEHPRDLGWFFSDWVTADKGLPDLSIDSAFPAPAPGGTFLVAVNVSNAGYAGAEVPLTVRTARGSETQRVLVPARGKIVQRILVNGDPTSVELNDGTVPETQASVHELDITAPPAGSSSSLPGPQ